MRRYYEFALTVIIVGLLSLVLMAALQKVRSDVEEAGVQAEAAAIRAQLLEFLAHRETFGGNLPNSDNPFDWVPTAPANYLGAIERTPRETSVWYFDTTSGELRFRFHDERLARFRLSREAGKSDGRGVLAGVGLLRLSDKSE